MNYAYTCIDALAELALLEECVLTLQRRTCILKANWKPVQLVVKALHVTNRPEIQLDRDSQRNDACTLRQER